MPWLQLRFDYDATTIQLQSDYDVSNAPASHSTQAKMNLSIFHHSRILVESQLWCRFKAQGVIAKYCEYNNILQ